MGFFSSLFGGDEAPHDVKSESSKTYGGGTKVTTYENTDGTKTEVSQYKDNAGYPHIVVADKDSTGNETGHTTFHGNPVEGITSNQHGSHKD